MPGMNQIAHNKSDAAREKILDAAWTRLGHYGLGKTTMAEIADDCCMSAANLYRYFKNKNDIAAACCDRAMAENVEELKTIVHGDDMSATEKLRMYAIRMVELNVERSAGKDKIGELVANMSGNNPHLIHEKIARHHGLIAEILAQGNAADEFAVDDVLKTAEMVYTSLVVFDVPIFAELYPLDHYRKMAASIVDMIIKGIGKT